MSRGASQHLRQIHQQQQNAAEETKVISLCIPPLPPPSAPTLPLFFSLYQADVPNAVTGQCLSVDGGLTMPKFTTHNNTCLHCKNVTRCNNITRCNDMIRCNNIMRCNNITRFNNVAYCKNMTLFVRREILPDIYTGAHTHTHANVYV